ncbi:MAG: hypothetical protein NC393_00180 [Clostridium sp.]|nr:hypothetical protein [Clostridium sp.]MCM1207912.1 hypothetical protein [Ruminococcus sp.]
MKRKIISFMLCTILMVATVGASYISSSASDENVQNDMQVNNDVEDRLTEGATDTDVAALEQVTTTEMVVDVENSEATNAVAVLDNGSSSEKSSTEDLGNEKNGQKNEDGITDIDADTDTAGKLEDGEASDEKSDVNFDTDMDTAGGLEDGEVPAKKRDEDMVLSDEEATEEMAKDNETTVELLDEDTSEEELLVGAEVEKLENVEFRFWARSASVNSQPLNMEYTIRGRVQNDNEFNVYLACLKGYVIDEKGNEYNIPISVSAGKNPDSDTYNITNDTTGYLGYNNESVLTDESVLVAPTTDAFYFIRCTVPSELEGKFSMRIYAEYVRLDDANGKVVASYSKTDVFYLGYNRVINIENSNYDIKENCEGVLDNVDINVYHDGNYLTAEAEANFYIQISNHNDYDLLLEEITSRWARTVLGLPQDAEHQYNVVVRNDDVLDFVHSKGMQIIDANGKNIVNDCCRDHMGYYVRTRLNPMEEWSFIKAGETVTYKVNCTLSPDDDGKLQPIDFTIGVSDYSDSYRNDDNNCTYRCFFMPFGDMPAVSIDKADETAPDIKLDDEAYDELINSAFTEAEIKSGKHLKVDLIVAALSEADVEQSELETIKAVAKKRKIAVILDMNIVKFIDGIISGNVNQLDKEIIMTIDVPKEFQAANRKFSIIRLHDGIAEELPDLDDNPNTVTFTTGKFSFYTLIYEDAGEGTALEPPKNDTPSTVEPTKTNVPDAAVTPVKAADNTKQAASPNTGDTTPVAVVFILMLVSAVLAVICTKKIKRDNK